MCWWLTLLFACSDDGCAPDLDPGGLEASLDGAEWAADDAVWRLAGSALQINASAEGEGALSVVLQSTTDGTPADEAEPPFTVDLGEGGGGWIVHYPQGATTSLSSGVEGGSGTFEVASREDDALAGCFTAVLAGDAGTVALTGSLVAGAAPAP